MADLTSALHSCRCGGHIRDDLNMREGWKICFVPHEGQEAKSPTAKTGDFVYIKPNNELAHRVRFFSHAMKASPCWHTIP